MAVGFGEVSRSTGIPKHQLVQWEEEGRFDDCIRRDDQGRRHGYAQGPLLARIRELVKTSPVTSETTPPLPPPSVEVHGMTPADKAPDLSRVWEKARSIQHGKEAQIVKRYSQRITLHPGGDGREPCKLLAINTGNHDNRTLEIAGIDWLLELVQDCTLLYDQHEVQFTLSCGEYEGLWKLRHKWKYNSRLNPFHSFMQDLRLADDWDVAVGGHVHSGTHWARWDHYSRDTHGPTDRYAVLIGTYEFHSKFGLKCGFARHTGRGCATSIIWPNGGMMLMDSCQMAAEYLKFAWSRYGPQERPYAIAKLSDIHLGNEYCDYEQVFLDVQTIINTPGMYAMLLGDAWDNWIGKLESIQRAQPMSHGEEATLVRSVMGALTGKPQFAKIFLN